MFRWLLVAVAISSVVAAQVPPAHSRQAAMLRFGPRDVVNAVWAVNDGAKIEKDDLANPSKFSNSA